MARFNTGILFTNDNCIGCNKCISQCSVMGANVSVIKNGKTKILIDGDKCNHCGKCIRLCTHDARDYHDDIEGFFEALNSGKKVSLIVSPSFYMIYKEDASNILGYLKSLGIDKIYDAAFGADICLWGHVNYLHAHENENNSAYITQTCPALINMIELYYPDLLDKIIPVQSPMMCTAIYARKYLGDNNEIAFLGPCISKKDEINALMTGKNVQYSITFKRLFEVIGNVDMSSYSAESDLKTDAFGNFIPVAGGFGEALKMFFPANEQILSKEGLTPYLFSLLKGCARVPLRDERPLVIDVLACMNGCQEGPGVDLNNYNYDKLYCDYNRKKHNLGNSTPDERVKLINERFKELNPEDFKRIFEDRYKQQFKVPESTIQEIFSDMLKKSVDKQTINCHLCGYNTCRDMATAIALGYNKKENCIHYMNEQMVQQLNTDSMTGFMNRASFQKQVKEVIDANPDKSYIIAVGNINKIKIINDLYGSKIGDIAIQKSGENLISNLKYEGFIARLGGDSYAFCVEYTVENLELVYHIPPLNLTDYGIEIPVTMRFGIYIADTSIDDILSVMNLATIAMSGKISSSKNTFSMFTKEMHQNIKREIEITSQMQTAIGNDEFQLYYQPQINCSDEKLAGAEALCRWIQPDGTMISPSVFIPISEKNGFIRALDKAIWDKAFKNVRKWIDEGITPVPTSVNISRISLNSDDFIYSIQRIQEKYQIPVDLIHFEITESAYMEDQENLIRRVNMIRKMGFQIAMDDFGSGYSSLNTLKDIPIDFLKLDMGFIKENSNMDKGGLIVNSIVKMAQSLNLVTIAEGVETQGQAEFLKTIGVNIIQGYFYSRPVSQSEYEERLRRGDSQENTPELNFNEDFDLTMLINPDTNENKMFEKISGPSCIFDIGADDISLLKINKNAIKLLGLDDLTFGEIGGILSKKIKDEKCDVISEIKKTLEKEEKYIYEMQFENEKRQKLVWVRCYISKIGTLSSDKYIIYAQLEDITQEKLYEKTLKLANTQVELLVNNSNVGLILFQTKFNLTNIKRPFIMKVLDVNSKFEQISGYKKEQVMNWSENDALDVVHPMDRPGFMASIIKAARTENLNSITYEYRAKKADGKYEKVRIYLSAIHEDNNTLTVVSNYVVL